MKKYILFAAEKRDCSCRFWQQGDWRATKYVIYSDGVCYRTMEYVDEPDQTRILRMDIAEFLRLQDLLKTKFDGVESDWGCDGIQWKMYHYAPGGKLLHGTDRCFAEHIPALKEIKEVLEQC